MMPSSAPLEYPIRYSMWHAKSVCWPVCAANALKEFGESDVPQEFYEEFVYRPMKTNGRLPQCLYDKGSYLWR
jgi:hypothetical protein